MWERKRRGERGGGREEEKTDKARENVCVSERSRESEGKRPLEKERRELVYIFTYIYTYMYIYICVYMYIFIYK